MVRNETTIDLKENLDIKELAMGLLLMDDYCFKILMSTTLRNMSIRDIAFTYFIPFATCYKKIAQLEAAGLIRKIGKEGGKKGKQGAVYRSCLEHFKMNYKSSSLTLNVDLMKKGPKTIELDLIDGNMVVTD